jgi:hypothetical protein
MTSLAFGLGVVPLVTGKGAGAEMRFALGIAVLAGITGVTAFGIFFTPVFYSVIRRLTERRGGPTPAAHAGGGGAAAGASAAAADTFPVTGDVPPKHGQEVSRT